VTISQAGFSNDAMTKAGFQIVHAFVINDAVVDEDIIP
jgi:hypothetical protein